jgi:hypothetical protein
MAHWLATSREFQVCGTCHELSGPFVWKLKGVEYPLVQECACAHERRVDGERPETWRGFDYNTVAELCQACGCQVLDSGSRFSMWFCGACNQRAVDLNAEVGRPVVPIGRHTIMHGVALHASPKPTDTEIEAFVARFGPLVERMKRVRDWGHEVVSRNLTAIARENEVSVPLAAYLGDVTSIDRAARFDAMVTSMTVEGTGQR